MNSVVQRNLIDLQKAMLLEIILSNGQPKFDPASARTNMDTPNLLASDLAMRLRASQFMPNAGFYRQNTHLPCHEDMRKADGGTPSDESGSSSPGSSCNTHTTTSSSSRGSHSNSSGSQSGRSSHSPSETPPCSHSGPDRGGSSPVDRSPLRGDASAHRSLPKSDGQDSARPAPAAANKAVGGDGDPTADGAKRKRSWKILLTAELAAEIYAQRPRRGESTGALARP